MANDITSGVWRIDTLPFSVSYPVKIWNIIWTEQTAAGDQLVIQTVAGKSIVDVKAYAANYPIVFNNIGWYPSLTITTLTSGIVLIAVGAGR